VSGRPHACGRHLRKHADSRLRPGGRRVDRLSATKVVAAEFIKRRQGDRVGLILFGRQAYLQAPLTFDLNTVARLLDEAQVGFAGEETAIGDAIGLALKRAKENPDSRSVVILLTDGANTASVIDPQKAAELPAPGLAGVHDRHRRTRRLAVRPAPRGSDLDEPALRAIAATTGGQYFRAHGADELERIYTCSTSSSRRNRTSPASGRSAPVHVAARVLARVRPRARGRAAGVWPRSVHA
jgi:Ca-activated chloride channel family protein